MNYQRLITGFFLVSTILCAGLLAREPVQIQGLVEVEERLNYPSVKDVEIVKINNEKQRDEHVVISIPDVPHIEYKKTTPKKLSWSEWLTSFGSAFKDYWTQDPERWQLPATMFAAGAVCAFVADPNGQMQAIKDLTGPAVLSMLVAQYLRYFLVNAAHESGHAAANYFVSGEISDIYLGSAAADGVEILPHIILAGLDPSRGQSTNIINPMISEGVLQENLLQGVKTFQVQYPKMSMAELYVLPAFQQACAVARTNSETKTVPGRLRYFAVMIAGVVAGLVTNGLVKLGMGKSVLSIDHVDMTQLFNLFPAAGFDGGAITSKIFDLPRVADAAQNFAVPAAFAMFFLKALTELNARDPNQNSISTIVHACGLALMNFSTNGLMHFTGN